MKYSGFRRDVKRHVLTFSKSGQRQVTTCSACVVTSRKKCHVSGCRRQAGDVCCLRYLIFSGQVWTKIYCHFYFRGINLSSMFKILFKVTGSFQEINKLVSSANKVDPRREESQRSLTYTMRNRGPTIEPCGALQRINSGNDPWPLYCTNWDLW